MLSRLKRGVIRLLPREWVFFWKRAQASLFLSPLALETCERERFFHFAFKALAFNGIDGDYAEFGSHQGMTLAHAYHQSRGHGLNPMLWAFDSFEGLPASQGPKDEHPKWREGFLASTEERFHYECRQNHVPRDAYTTVVGFFEDSLGAMSPEDEPKNICLAYIDCDLHSSTRTVLEYLAPRLKHGMIIAFDDYHCWSPEQLAGERRAMMEFFEKNERWRLAPFVQYGWHGASFVVEDKRL